MRYLTLFFILICSNLQAQLTRGEKFVYASYTKIEKHLGPYTFYYGKSNIEKKQRVLNWVNSDLKNSNDHRFRIAYYRLNADFNKLRGNYQIARKFLEDGIAYLESIDYEVARRDVVIQGVSFLDIYDELGELYLDLGNNEIAKGYFEKSRSLKTKHSKNKVFTVRSDFGIGEILIREGKVEAAITLWEDISSKLLSSSLLLGRGMFSKCYTKLTDLYIKNGQYKDAFKAAKIARSQSLSIGSVGGFIRQQLDRSNAEVLISKSFLLQGNLPQADKWIETADNTFLSKYKPSINQYTEILKQKASIALIKTESSKSLMFLEELMDNHMRFVNNNFSNLSQIEKERFYSKISEDLNFYFDTAIKVYEMTQDQEILKSILERRIQTKGFILNDQNKIKQAIQNGGDELLKQKLIEWQGAKEAMAYYLFEDPNSPSIDSLNKVINSLERSLSEKTNLLASLNKRITDSEIHAQLLKGDVAIELLRYTSEYDKMIRYAAILMNFNTNSYQLVLNKINSEDEIRFSKYYKSAIQYETRDENTYSSLWESIDQQIGEVNRVLLSPDGIYHQVNINTLQDASGNYMIDKYQVVNMTNLKDLTNEASGEYASSAYLFGRPQYDYTKDMDALFNLEDDQLMRSNLFMELESFNEQEFADLPGTEAEVQSISGTLNQYQWSTHSFTGPVATEQKVKSLDNPGIVHIATHGFFLEATGHVNPMIKSGLVMAGVNNKGETMDDGVLTAYEATNLKLDNTWLVVLSACETGLGDIKNGEGVYGLQRALTVAGASNLMMTLWKVDDTATKELMINFYDQLGKGVELEEAFRNSQIQLREKYPHPKYWGSFVLVKAKG